MKNLTIRQATVADVNLISVLATTTNYETYFQLDPSHDLADYCIRFFNLETIKSELDSPHLTYLIAEFNKNAVGFALMREGKEIECLKDKEVIEIQRIYVIEKMKSKGIGKALMEKCREIGREKGYQTIWLGVWEKILRLRSFIKKSG